MRLPSNGWSSNRQSILRSILAIGLLAPVWTIGACGDDDAEDRAGPGDDGGATDGTSADLRDGEVDADARGEDVADDCPVGQWCLEHPRPFTADVFGIWGSAAKDVWVVGSRRYYNNDGYAWDQGRIVHYDGHRWREDYSGPESLRAVRGRAIDDVWAVGSDELIVHFDGTHWTRVHGGADAGAAGGASSLLVDVWPLAADDVWAVTGGMQFLHYDGTAWTKLPDSPGASTPPLALSCRFRSEDEPRSFGLWGYSKGEVFAAGCNIVAQFNGARWRYRAVDEAANLRAIWGWTPDRILVGGDTGVHQLDANSLALTGRFNIGSYTKIAGNSKDRVWGLRSDGRVYHVAGFQNEILQKPPVFETPEQFFALWVGPDATWAGAPGGKIVQLLGEGSNQQFDFLPGTFVTDEDLYSVVPIDAQARWASGARGAVMRRREGQWSLANNWADGGFLSTNPNHVVSNVAPVAENEAWATFYQGESNYQLLHFEGTGWSPAAGFGDGGSAPALSGVSATGKTDVWVVGSGAPLVAHYDGASWVNHTLPFTSPDVPRVRACAPNDVWVATSGTVARMARYDGASWALAEATTDGVALEKINRLWCAAPGDVWGTSRTAIYHYVQGQWTKTAPTLPEASSLLEFTAISGNAPNDIWVLATDGYFDQYVYHFDGNSWTYERAPNRARSLAASDGRVWVSGEEGILHVQRR